LIWRQNAEVSAVEAELAAEAEPVEEAEAAWWARWS
jgi:hypothetical protein